MEICLIMFEGSIGGITEMVRIFMESEQIRGFGRSISGLMG